MTAYDAVVFDLDSTLCVADQDDRDIHEAIFERVGREPFFDPADLNAVDVTDLPEAESDHERYVHLYGATADRVGADPDEAVLEALAEATLEVYDSTLVSFRDGARDAIEYARERYAVGLLTNGTEDTQRAKLDRLGVADAFDATVFCGSGTGHPSKPAREPFDAVLEGLDAPAERAVYVGDRLEGDVAGGARRGHGLGVGADGRPAGRPGTRTDLSAGVASGAVDGAVVWVGGEPAASDAPVRGSSSARFRGRHGGCARPSSPGRRR